MELRNGKPVLKKDHEYYTQIQMDMGICGAQYCDFVVYTFKGLIISGMAYDHERLVSVMKKINICYRKYMLPELMKCDVTPQNNYDRINWT